MKASTLTFAGALLFAACSPSSQNKAETAKSTSDSTIVDKYKTTGTVERLDPEINNLIAENAEIEILASGFTWSEGPLWIPSLNAVVFTDVPENIAYKWSEPDGLKEYLKPSGYTGQAEGKEGANGLILDLDGNLVLCQHGDRRVARMKTSVDSPEESYETITAEYNGKKLNSPNDLVQNSNGVIFFTDPPYGLKDDDQKELDFQGVYRIDTTGNLSLLIDSLSFPNGIALSPDEKILYVAVSDSKKAKYYAYDLDESGNITAGKVLLDVTSMYKEGKSGSPDGLKVDDSGNLFATGPGGVLVISPEGKHLGTINTGQRTANCAFNEDKSALYMTAHMHLMRIQLK